MALIRLARSTTLFTAGLAWSALALAQDSGTSKPDEAQGNPVVELPNLGGLNEQQQEMVRLFHEVQRTLESIDVELFDASAGRIPLPEGRDSGIDRLLRSNGEKSDQAVSGIERILELAQEMGGSCKSGMCNQPKEPGSSGKSPLDKERERGPTQAEMTPEGPKPGEEGKQGDKPKPEPQGEKPDDRGKNPPPGENRPSLPRNDAGGTPATPGDDADRWGALPERVQRVFQNQITDDLPLQYRDWIDSYYRRLNQVR